MRRFALTLLLCASVGTVTAAHVELDLERANEVFPPVVEPEATNFNFLGQPFGFDAAGQPTPLSGPFGHSGFAPLGGPAPPQVFSFLDSPTNPGPDTGASQMDGSFPERITRAEDLFSVEIRFRDGSRFRSETHLVGDELRLIPYAEGHRATDASGREFRSDTFLSEHFAPGALGYVIKHQRSQNRVLDVTALESAREEIKLQDRHVGILVGVQSTDGLGVITLNNPQDYEEGRFGDKHHVGDYPMILARPRLPDHLPPSSRRAFIDNIRTMAVALNTVSHFPDDYNGGDPLSASTLEAIQTIVARLIQAVAGNPSAQAFFEDTSNYMYCSELAYLATSAGLQVPLNWACVEPLGIERSIWKRFQEEIARHNANRAESFFIANNRNPHIGKVELASEDHLAGLLPAWKYAEKAGIEAPTLALPPMTMADMLDAFMRLYFQREKRGERFAAEQALILAEMKRGLFELLDLDADSEAGKAVDHFYGRVVEAVGREYPDYETFRRKIAPLLQEAREMTGGNGIQYFTPPSLFHLALKGMLPEPGLLGLDYVGHGIHFSLVRIRGRVQNPRR